MVDTWRLIIDEELDGALNMALDRAGQLAREQGLVPPTLRLYGWARPTVTLGRFQQLTDVDEEVASVVGVDVVRRATGGRGVLHDDEVTYSVIASVEDGIPRGVAASYRHLCSALSAAYGNLGIRADLEAGRSSSGDSPACYLTSTRADLALSGRKLSGSAQVWSGTTVLQHGSFVRSRDVALEARLFRLDAAAQARLEADAVTLDGALWGEGPSIQCIRDAVIRGFGSALGIILEPGHWTALEASIARESMYESG